jgi:hypothetical protein
MNWKNNGLFSFLCQFFLVPNKYNDFMDLSTIYPYLLELILMGYDLLQELYFTSFKVSTLINI